MPLILSEPAPRRHRRAKPWQMALLAFAALPVQAQQWGGALGFGNNNLYRGLSLSGNQPAWLADLHYSPGPDWVAGLGASAERPPRQSAGAQLMLYLDRRWVLDEAWTTKLGAIHYASPWNDRAGHWNYDELNATLSYRGRWRLAVATSPNYPSPLFGAWQNSGRATWTELGFHQALYGRLATDIGVGYADVQPSGYRNYNYGSAGLSYGIGDLYGYVARVWSSSSAGDYPRNPYSTAEHASAHWTISLIWSF